MSDSSEHDTDVRAGAGRMARTGSIVVAAVVGFGVVSFWRGVWYLWDVFTLGQGDRLVSALASMIAGIVILAVMRTFYSVLAPPIERLNIR